MAASLRVAPQPLVSTMPLLSELSLVAGQRNGLELRQYLTSAVGHDIDHVDVNGWTLMHHAAYEGLLPVVKMLRRAGISTDIRDRMGLLPLDYAEFGGHLETVQLLREGSTASIDILTAAAANAQRALEHLLAQPDTDVNARNVAGKTALHLTAPSGYLNATLQLVAAGADLRVRDNDGKTPYDLAAAAGQAAVASVFVGGDG